MVTLGEYILAVPEGWTLEEYSGNGINGFLVEHPQPSLMRFAVEDHPQDLGPEIQAGGLCASYNKTTLEQMGPGKEEMTALPINLDGNVDAVICAAEGTKEDGVHYQYLYTAFFDLSTYAGVILQERAELTAQQENPDQFRAWSDYYVCAIAHQSGADVVACR